MLHPTPLLDMLGSQYYCYSVFYCWLVCLFSYYFLVLLIYVEIKQIGKAKQRQYMLMYRNMAFSSIKTTFEL